MPSLSEFLFTRTSAYADLGALRVRGRTVTYRELNRKALQVAAGLVGAGADHETVGIVGQRKTSSYFGILGVLYAGCRYVPLNPKYSSERLGAMLRDSNVRFLVGDSDDLGALVQRLEVAGIPAIEAVVIPEGSAPEKSGWLGDRELATCEALTRPIASEPEHGAYLLYTSGSTGVPKGVQVSQGNVLAFLRSMAAIYAVEPGFRASQTFDLSFDLSVSDMFFTWTNGGVLCVLPEEEVMLPHEYVRREGITFWSSVPTLAGFLRRMGHLAPGSFPDLRHSVFCGEPFPQHLADAWRRAAPNSTVENLYGPTEATIYISRFNYRPEDESTPFTNGILPIGRPFLEHKFAIVNQKGDQLLGSESGEIVFKGPQITIGYLNDQVKTDSAFVSFPWDSTQSKWYKSGDVGFYNSNGDLEWLGRVDNQVKIGGRRIEIGEIEAVLHRNPLTQDAVVVPIRDEQGSVTGFVAFTASVLGKEQESTLRRESEKALERIFFPKRFVTIDTFPLTPSGKIDRKELASKAQSLFPSQVDRV